MMMMAVVMVAEDRGRQRVVAAEKKGNMCLCLYSWWSFLSLSLAFMLLRNYEGNFPQTRK